MHIIISKMKVRNILLFVTISMLSSFVMSCSKDETSETLERRDVLAAVTAAAGVIHYDSVISRWFISVPVEGTIDTVKRYYPISIDSEFQHDGIQVLFSGSLYMMDSSLRDRLSVPAGTECYMIELITITKQQGL